MAQFVVGVTVPLRTTSTCPSFTYTPWPCRATTFGSVTLKPTSRRFTPASFCRFNAASPVKSAPFSSFTIQPSPASYGVTAASMSLPYRGYPASSRSVSRAPRPPGSDQRVPQGFRVRRAAVQLEPVLSRVPGPGDEALHPGDLPLGEVIVGNHRHADGSERCEQRLGPRTLHSEQRSGLRDVAQPYVRAALLRHDVLPVGGDVGGVHDQHEAVLEAIHQTVVHEGALLRQDAGVLGLSWFQRPNVVARDSLHEGVPVGTADLELAHVRYVEHPHVLAHGAVLGRDPRRIADRHFVAAERDVDLVQRRAFHRAMSVASRAFCTCSRFSASSHTRDCGPSITSAVTSSPRWAGRQCRKMAFASASFIKSGSTV